MKPSNSHYRIFSAFLLVGLLTLQSLFGEVIDVTNKQGQTISAELLGYDGTNIEICRTDNRKKFKIAVADLNDKTQAAIKEWLEKGGNLVKSYEVEVSTGKATERSSSYSDSKILRLDPSLTVKNPDITQDSKPAYITILFLGRPTEERSQIHVFKKQTFEIPKLEPLKSTSFKVEAVATRYSDDSEYGYGERYLGYIWVVHNKATTDIYAAKSVPTPYAEKFARNFLMLKEEGTYFDDTFRPVPATRY